jgi:hypothetical protein
VVDFNLYLSEVRSSELHIDVLIEYRLGTSLDGISLEAEIGQDYTSIGFYTVIEKVEVIPPADTYPDHLMSA